MRDTDGVNAAAGKTDRVLLAIIAAVTLLVVIALAVVFTRGEPEVLDEATPPGVVQRYSTAVIDGDTATANSYLTQVARSSCSGYRESGPLPARVVLISTTERTVPAAGSALLTLRRLILYVLLFALVVIAAIGLSGLLERLFSTGAVLASTDVAWLARSLAFTLIGGPLAGLLWWVVWRRLDDAAERAAAGWGLYLTAIYAVSLIVATSSLLGMAASFVGPQEPRWYSPLSNGLVWAAVWFWHRWMWRHPVKHPVNLEDVPAVIGTVFGLLTGAFSAITAWVACLTSQSGASPALPQGRKRGGSLCCGRWSGPLAEVSCGGGTGSKVAGANWKPRW